MRGILNYICVFVFLFMYFEPLHSYSTLQNFAALSGNGDSRDSIRYSTTNPTDQEAINALIVKYLGTKAVTSPRPKHSVDTSPNPAPAPGTSVGELNRHLHTVDKNVTTSYYRTYVENYPDYSEVEEKLKKFQGFTISDTLPEIHLDSKTLLDDDADQYKSLCPFRTELIQPQEIMNKDKRNVLVVNYPGRFEQIIGTEVCLKTDIECDHKDEFPNNLIPICKQNIIFRRVVTFNEAGEPHSEDIPIPASCVCMLKDTTLRGRWPLILEEIFNYL